MAVYLHNLQWTSTFYNLHSVYIQSQIKPPGGRAWLHEFTREKSILILVATHYIVIIPRCIRKKCNTTVKLKDYYYRLLYKHGFNVNLGALESLGGSLTFLNSMKKNTWLVLSNFVSLKPNLWTSFVKASTLSNLLSTSAISRVPLKPI